MYSSQVNNTFTTLVVVFFSLSCTMADFDKYLAQGQKLGLTDQKLMDYVQQCEDRAQRLIDRDRELSLKIEEEGKMRKHVEIMKEMEITLKLKEHDVEIKKMDTERASNLNTEHGGHGHDSGAGPKTSYIPKLPPFDEKSDEIDSFLFRFESHAKSCGWTEDKWPLYAASLFKGSALSLYHSLAAKQDLSWDDLKQELLRKFQCTDEGFRSKFRSVRPETDESFAAFLIRSGHYFDRWIELSNITCDFNNLRDILLREQILQSVSPDLATFLRERSFSSAEEMCKLADQYKNAHPHKSFARKTNTQVFDSNVSFSTDSYGTSDRGFPRRNSFGNEGNNLRFGRGQDFSRGKFPNRGYAPYRGLYSTPSQGVQEPLGQNLRYHSASNRFQGPRRTNYSPRVGNISGRSGYSWGESFRCWTCGCQFHRSQNCPYAYSKTANVGETKLNSPVGHQGHEEQESHNAYNENTEVKQGLVSHKSREGLVIEDCSINGYSASLLRDTGCTTAGVKRSYVRNDQYTGQVQRCRTFGGRTESFPLARVTVHTPYFEGTIEACVIDEPVADLILGNLPGIRTTHGGQGGTIVCKPTALVTTRSQSKSEDRQRKPLPVPRVPGLDIQPDKFKELQKSDQSLTKCFEQVTEEKTLDVNTHCFILRDGVLTRVYQGGSDQVYQIVVPKTLRNTVLQVSHDIPMSGHFGVRRTLNRVLLQFYWPTVRKDVTHYCQSCDACQRTIPKGRVPCAPLQQMPIISDPFQRIAIDIVGPVVPSSSSGYKYILTIVDVATRYPEAIPLKKIDTVTVAEALFSVFCRMGCPKEILSDCGTQFVSELMTEVYRLLSVKPVTTTPYHPQSNGMVERFNGTLKAMLRRVIQDQPKEWDRYIPAVLFAYRELPSASTGFSPFELMFGRPARGPTYILAQTWSGQCESDEDKALYQYVFELKNKLESTCSLAQEQVLHSMKTNKSYADRKAKARSFKPGQKVLVLLSDEKNKLQTKWKGPFRVLDRLNQVDYKIEMAGVVKTFHVNMLKLYVDREPVDQISVNISVHDGNDEANTVIPFADILPADFLPQNVSVHNMGIVQDDVCVSVSESNMVIRSGCVGVISESEDEGTTVPTIPTFVGETYADVHISDKLDKGTVTEIQTMLREFSDILTDKPGKAKGVEPHHIKLTDEIPVRRKPYPLPFSTRQIVEREVENMLQLGVIEPSTSSFCSPVVLVSKSDGSVRFCVDFRALNKKTFFDCEPIPDADELFCQLSHANYFAKIDLTKGYWQVPIDNNDKAKTAFQTPLGLFQWKVMPFGLQNAPATFARVMRSLKLHENSAVSFFDDILVHSTSMSDLLIKVREVLGKLRDHGLCARPTKMFVGFRELDFLGHRLVQGYLKPQTGKVDKILNIQVPRTKRQVRALLGLISYYRRYVPNFSEITYPLTELTKKSAQRTIQWTAECQSALEQIQKALSTQPILLLPDLEKTFTLRTDASAKGMGGVLLQEANHLLHPVRFISKKFTDSQLRYSTIERECLAIVWAVTYLSRFLAGREFVLQTDHRPLTFLEMSKTRNNRLLRWALMLQEFKFSVCPISGHSNTMADLLSRA